jgi:two-component system nitrate/nitrite response regulator NarL
MRGALKTHLTPREAHVIDYLKIGFSNREIAEELGIAVGTVKVHLVHAYRKLGCRSRLQAATLYGQARARAS